MFDEMLERERNQPGRLLVRCDLYRRIWGVGTESVQCCFAGVENSK